MKKDLSDDGVFILNYIGTLRGEPMTLTGSIVKTLQSVFPNLKMYAFNKSNPDTRQNIIFLARKSDTPIEIDDQFFKVWMSA